MDKDIEKKLDAVLNAIQGLEVRIAQMETGGKSPSVGKKAETAPKKRLSIREFLLMHPPATDVLRTLAVGYYLESHEDMSSFSRADLEKGYRDAKHSLPSNMSMNIKRCIEAGNMMEAKEKKDGKSAYVVTSTGEQFIESGYKKPDGK